MRSPIFIDWTAPALRTAATLLVERFDDGDEADMSRVVCVLPGARAGRLLLIELLKATAASDRVLIPPRVVTPGALADVLLRFGRPVASPTELELAWMRALEEFSPERLAQILGGELDHAAMNRAGTPAVARLLMDLFDELAAGDRRFADVAAVAASRGMHREAERWRGLAALEEAFLEVLEARGLEDPLAAVRRAVETSSFRDDASDIILVGITELNRRQRTILEALRERLLVLVHAPASHSDSFDDLGCVRIDAWMDADIDIDDRSIHFADRPFDQAQAAIGHLADRAASGGRPCDDVVLGLGDPTLQPALIRCARWAGVTLHPAAGAAINGTPPILLLERVADWLDDRRFHHLTDLLRHPDVERWLRQKHRDDEEVSKGIARWLGLLEEYFSEHMQGRFTGEWLGDEVQQQRLHRIHDGVASLLTRFDDRSRPLQQWAQRISSLLCDVFGHISSATEQRQCTFAACIELRDLLERLMAADRSLQPEMSAVEAIRFILEHARNITMPVPFAERQVDLLGWLELHLDPAPVLILSGFNDGCIPSSVTGHAFLPDSLRAMLGLSHNASRSARDAYLLTAMLASREEVDLIVGRRGENDEPLTPSRFLFAADDETVCHRIHALSPQRTGRLRRKPSDAVGVPAPAGQSRFTVPELPRPIEPPPYMRVTDFRLYIACPYRYALQRLIRIETVERTIEEMDPLQFGSLAHEVLDRFGKSELKVSAHAEEIEKFLLSEVDRLARMWFGEALLPAIHVQLAHLKQRLRDFARRQAEWRSEGWEIIDSEREFDEEIALDIPGQPDMPLRGKIDRIDYNAQRGLWRIIDYKTGEAGASPHEAHHGAKKIPANPEKRWRDLQLPLYHYLPERAGIVTSGDPVELGYVVLPKQSGGVRFINADWDASLLEEAVDVAREVVRKIRDGCFTINESFSDFEIYPRLCQTNVFGGANLLGDPEDAEDPAELEIDV